MKIGTIAEQFLSIENKVAVVSGAGSGIGRGICLRLAQFGATVVVLDIDETGAQETVRQITAQGRQAMYLRCDVRSEAEAKQSMEKVLDTYGGVDILCNNAGVAVRKDIVALTEEEWDRSVDVILKGIYTLSRHAIPAMAAKGGGAIVNTGSGWSLKGGPMAAAYCAAKGGVVNLTRAMAIDHGPQNIRVNCVCPGDIPTPMLYGECEQLGENLEAFLLDSARRPLSRLGSVEDVANAVLFLVSPMSSWITGTSLVVDGGGIA